MRFPAEREPELKQVPVFLLPVEFNISYPLARKLSSRIIPFYCFFTAFGSLDSYIKGLAGLTKTQQSKRKNSCFTATGKISLKI